MHPNLSKGTSATFSVGHVVCPDVGDVLSQIGPDLTVTGEVMYLSDGGHEKDKFAVVRVAGIAAPLIVPTVRLKDCNATTSDAVAGIELQSEPGR